MAHRFVTPTKEGADYTVDGVGFKYLVLSEEEADKIMREAAKYKVIKEEVERYSHDEYGDYESVEEVMHYEFADMRSLSEKIWLRSQGAGDIIVENGEFMGVVFFTGFTDYRELEELGVVPLEHLYSREKLTCYVSVEVSILLKKITDVQAYRSTVAQWAENGRSTTAYRTNFYLAEK